MFFFLIRNERASAAAAWTVEEGPHMLLVRDDNERALPYVYFEDESAIG